MAPPPESSAHREQLKKLLQEVIAPVFPGVRGSSLPADLPRQAVETLDRIGDLEASAADILELLGPQGGAAKFLEPGDRVAKQGRKVAFGLEGPRRIASPDLAVTLELSDSFELEFRTGAERFESLEVQARFEKARKDLPRVAPADLLAAAVLPQRKGLLGASTPVRIRIAGIPFSFAFAALAADRGKLRLFVAGPVVREIPL